MDEIKELVKSLGFLLVCETAEYIVYETTIDNIFYSLYIKCDCSNIIMDNTSFDLSLSTHTHRTVNVITYIEKKNIDSVIVFKMIYDFFKVKLRQLKMKTVLNNL